MARLARIGIDTSKSVFQLHGVDEKEQVALRKQLRRRQLLMFFTKLEPTLVGLEACGASHHWARELQKLGHKVVLIPPQYVKPYVGRNKNDRIDAEAVCEAMSRPKVQERFVPIKSVEQSAAQMLLGVRESLIKRRTQLTNTIRGHAAEFGLVAARGLDKIEPLLARIAADDSLPVLTKEMFVMLCREYAELGPRIAQIDKKMLAFHRSNEVPDGSAGHRPDRRLPADHQDRRSPRLPLRPPLCRLDRSDAQGPFDRRQAEARRYHPRR
jgi:transposase